MRYSYLSRDDAELLRLESERRPGRPANAKEDHLKQRKLIEEQEYNSGYWLPDLEDTDTLHSLRDWDKEWTSLNTVKFIRVARSGLRKDSSFPPTGMS